MVKVVDGEERIVLSQLDARVLVALLAGPMNAYEIMGQVAKDTGTGVVISYGAISYALKGLNDYRFVANAAVKKGDSLGRSNYRVTTLGQQVLRWHIDGQERLIKLARDRGIDRA